MRSARCLLRVYICRCSFRSRGVHKFEGVRNELGSVYEKGKNIVIDLRGRSISVSENDKT